MNWYVIDCVYSKRANALLLEPKFTDGREKIYIPVRPTKKTVEKGSDEEEDED